MTTSRSCSPIRDNAALRDRGQRLSQGDQRAAGSSDIYVMHAGRRDDRRQQLRPADQLRRREFQLPPLFPGRDGGQARPLLRARHDLAEARLLFFGAGHDRRRRSAASSSSRSTSTPIEASWSGGDYEIIVSDPEGIIFMTEPAGLALCQPAAADAGSLARTEASRRYANATLRELPVTRGSFEDGHDADDRQSTGRAREYLVLSRRYAGRRLDGQRADSTPLGARAGADQRRRRAAAARPRGACRRHRAAAPGAACRAHGDAARARARSWNGASRSAPPISRWSTASSKPKSPSGAPPSSSCGRRSPT